ncbi:hypothetical protein E4K73_50460 [Streptomyces sp. IB201691-2A2]|nr:hypothetical protein E4K73_50460 [Streptomyces sp. IB201691-2A2]
MNSKRLTALLKVSYQLPEPKPELVPRVGSPEMPTCGLLPDRVHRTATATTSPGRVHRTATATTSPGRVHRTTSTRPGRVHRTATATTSPGRRQLTIRGRALPLSGFSRLCVLKLSSIWP